MKTGAEGIVAGPNERRSPGLAALFDALWDDGRHTALDLGPASGSHLRVLGRFASQVRFADLLRHAGDGPGWVEALGRVPANPGRPYDVVLLWDLLDRLAEEGRAALVSRLEEVTGPRARLYAVVAGEGTGNPGLHRFEILAVDRVAEWWDEVGARPFRPLLPAHLERALSPFEVVSAYMLRTGAREYVAMKRA